MMNNEYLVSYELIQILSLSLTVLLCLFGVFIKVVIFGNLSLHPCLNSVYKHYLGNVMLKLLSVACRI